MICFINYTSSNAHMDQFGAYLNTRKKGIRLMLQLEYNSAYPEAFYPDHQLFGSA